MFLGPQSGGGGSRGHSLGGLCIFDFAGCPFLKQEEEEQEEGGDGAAGDPKKEKKSLDSDESEDEEDDYQVLRLAGAWDLDSLSQQTLIKCLLITISSCRCGQSPCS